jgi:hypothetical protein
MFIDTETKNNIFCNWFLVKQFFQQFSLFLLKVLKLIIFLAVFNTCYSLQYKLDCARFAHYFAYKIGLIKNCDSSFGYVHFGEGYTMIH